MKRKMMRVVMVSFLVSAITWSMAWSIAWATDKGGIELKSVAEVEVVVTNNKGEKEVELVEASKASVVPGDEVIFTSFYTNVNKEPADKVVITNPVPEHMLYVDGSATGAGSRIVFSIDGGKSYGRPEELMVTGSDGKKRQAKSSEYSHIRWEVKEAVLQGKSGFVRFRAQLE